MLQELVGDKPLQRFRVEYEKLFRTLKKSHGARYDPLPSAQIPAVYCAPPDHVPPCSKLRWARLTCGAHLPDSRRPAV